MEEGIEMCCNGGVNFLIFLVFFGAGGTEQGGSIVKVVLSMLFLCVWTFWRAFAFSRLDESS